MILKEAVEIMKAHNEWRRGAETEMVNPKELGVAIDVLINHAEAGGKSAEEIKDNKIMLLEEDIWCVHKYFDDIKIPKSCKNGQQYSIVGRIKRLEERYLKQMSELESQYAHQQPVQGYAKDGWSFDYGFLQNLTSKVNESEWGENLSMEEVESVLLAIGYNPSATNESIANKISEYLFVNTGIEIEKIIDIKLEIQSMLSQQPVNDGWEGAHNIDDTEPPKQSV